MSIQLNDHMNSYEFTCELPSNGEVIAFKPFTTGQIKKLLVYENSKDQFIIERCMDDIINECVPTSGFDVNDMILQDRFYLFLKIREKSKGDLYNYTYRCPDKECRTDNVGGVKISELEMMPFDVDYTPVQITDKLSVKMKLITRGEQKSVYDLVSTSQVLTPMQKAIEAISLSIAVSMDVFYDGDNEDSEISLEDKMQYINNGLSAAGFEKVKQWLTDNDFGVKFEIPIKCTGCGKEDNYSIPLDDFFV